MTDDSTREPPEQTAGTTPAPPSDSAERTSPTAGALDALARERDEYHDLLLRKTAELDNYRKRIERERAEVDQAAATDLLTELLPLIDDLERALAVDADTDAVTAYRAGVELIHKRLLGIVEKRGVTPIDTNGQEFNPHYHQAVAHEVSADHDEGQIIDELRRGYMLGGRLLRPAMVRVAKA